MVGIAGRVKRERVALVSANLLATTNELPKHYSQAAISAPRAL